MAASGNGQALLEVEDLHTFYGNIEALKGISLYVEEGEVVTLIGSNGAGKTTTLRSISGLTPARTGTIRFRGRDISCEITHGHNPTFPSRPERRDRN